MPSDPFPNGGGEGVRVRRRPLGDEELRRDQGASGGLATAPTRDQAVQGSRRVVRAVVEDLEERCVVCGTHERTNAFVPCGHKAACEACAAQLLDTTRRCPVPGCAAHCLMSLRVSFAVTPPTTSRTPCNSPELQ